MKGKSSRERGKMLFLGSEQNIMFSSSSLSLFPFLQYFSSEKIIALRASNVLCVFCLLQWLKWEPRVMEYHYNILDTPIYLCKHSCGLRMHIGGCAHIVWGSFSLLFPSPLVLPCNPHFILFFLLFFVIIFTSSDYSQPCFFFLACLLSHLLNQSPNVPWSNNLQRKWFRLGTK